MSSTSTSPGDGARPEEPNGGASSADDGGARVEPVPAPGAAAAPDALDGARDTAPPQRSVVRPPWWAFVLVLAIAVRLFSVGEPWSPDQRDFHGLFGGFATGGPATDLAQRGLWESGGMPYQWRVDLADGTAATRWYMHHPPAYMLISAAVIQWLGVHADALRLVALVFSLFSIFAAYRFARVFADERTARVVAFLMAVVPYSARDGMQVWTEAAIAGTTCFVIAYGVRWMDGGRRRDLVSCGVWLALGALLDWPAHFVLPGLALYALVRCARGVPWRRFWWAWMLPALSIVLLGAHKLHMVAVAGSEGALEDSDGTLAYVMGWGPYANAEFFRTQLRFQVLGFTRPVLVLAAIGLLVSLVPTRRGRSRRVRGVVVWLGLLPGLWYVLLFPGRSNNHDFFMLVSAPAVCLAAAVGALALVDAVARCLRRTGRGEAVAATTLGVLMAGVALLSTLVVLVQWRRFASDELPRLASQPWLAPILQDESAVVVTHMSRAALLPFYSRAPVVYGTDGVGALEGFLAGIVDRVEPERRAVFLFDQDIGLTDPRMHPVLARLQTFERATEHVVDIGKGPQSFWLVELPTGGALEGGGATDARDPLEGSDEGNGATAVD